MPVSLEVENRICQRSRTTKFFIHCKPSHAEKKIFPTLFKISLDYRVEISKFIQIPSNKLWIQHSSLTWMSLVSSGPLISFSLAERMRHALAISFRFGLVMKPWNIGCWMKQVIKIQTTLLFIIIFYNKYLTLIWYGNSTTVEDFLH